MSKTKYKYNPTTLSYEKVKSTVEDRIWGGLPFLLVGVILGAGILFASMSLISTANEKKLKRENAQLQLQLSMLNKKMDMVESGVAVIEDRDNNIYRVIFEVEPVPEEIRSAGIGGSDRYADLKGFDHSESVIKTSKRLDILSRRIYQQLNSFDEVEKLALEKEKMLSAIPAIQPVSNEDLTRMASGFGMRLHPIYKVRKFHHGLDFTAPTGTEIYATGSGTVKMPKRGYGYGKHVVIDHGYGYQTLYAHMSKFAVKPGQKVKRGDVIGYVGNTGSSTGPHLHYEVIKNGNKINPISFLSDDLTPAEFEKILQMAEQENQSFD